MGDGRRVIPDKNKQGEIWLCCAVLHCGGSGVVWWCVMRCDVV